MNAAQHSQPKTIGNDIGATYTGPTDLLRLSEIFPLAIRECQSQQISFQYFWRKKSGTVHIPPASGKGRKDLVGLTT